MRNGSESNGGMGQTCKEIALLNKKLNADTAPKVSSARADSPTA